MDESFQRAPRLAPLPVDHQLDLEGTFKQVERTLGYLPNSFLIMQRRPKLLRPLIELLSAVWDPSGEVDSGFKRLIAHVASRAAGCQYCMAHTAGGALHAGIQEQKLAAMWEYRTSPLFTEGERAALDFALAAASVPNDVTDDMFLGMRRYWTEGQIVEIVAVISLFGFFNRWNDTMGTPLEDEPIAVGERFLASHGWKIGKHKRAALSEEVGVVARAPGL